MRNGEKPCIPRIKGKAFFNSVSVVSGVKVGGGTLHVPSFGALKMRREGGNPHTDGRPASVVLKRELGKWRAVAWQAVKTEGPADNGHVLGLDRNGGQVADSDGEIRELPGLERLDAQARRLQRRLSRPQKRSRRRDRTKRHVAKVRRRIANQRRNWRHQVGVNPARRAGDIAVGDLNAKGMTRPAKGAAEEPGTMVARKSGINRVVMNAGWTASRRMPDCKAAIVIVVPDRNAPRACRECWAVEEASRSTRDDFVRMAAALQPTAISTRRGSFGTGRFGALSH